MMSPISAASSRALRIWVRLVRDAAEVDDVAAAPFEQPGHGESVRVVDLRFAQGHAGFGQFVTGGEQNDPHPPAYAHRADAACGKPREVVGGEAVAGAANGAALGNVVAGRANMLAHAHRFVELDGCFAGDDVLLQHHAVCPGRHRCAREDADGLADARGLAGWMSGETLPRDLQALAPIAAKLPCANRIAVHRGGVEGRQAHRRDDVLCRDPAKCGIHPHAFGATQRLDEFAKPGSGHVDVEHCGFAPRHVSRITAV